MYERTQSSLAVVGMNYSLCVIVSGTYSWSLLLKNYTKQLAKQLMRNFTRFECEVK
jgi:hypothetical protein